VTLHNAIHNDIDNTQHFT